MCSIEERQQKELDFWRDSEHESPQSNSVENIINKASEAAIFLDCINSYRGLLSEKGTILELGGGQGWSCCLYKRLFPEARVILTDISRDAISSVHKWEHIWQSKVDHSYTCKSYDTREEDRTIDMIFCFASIHHFIEYEKTIKEMSRILKPGGRAFCLYEPVCPKFWYPLAYKRVNRKCGHVVEGVIIPSQLKKISQKYGLNFKLDFYPSLIRQGPKELIYYYILNKVSFLQKLMPCSANIVLEKPT